MSAHSADIASRIDAALAGGTVPWASPWIGGAQVARNLKTGKPYRGLNVLLLAMSPNPGQWWVTYKQATELGGQVRKGEKGTRLFFWMKYCPASKTDARKCKVPGHKNADHPLIMKAFTVFNAETQVDGLEGRIPARRSTVKTAEGACAIGLKLVDALAEYDLAAITEDAIPDGAWYLPKSDQLNLPGTERFMDGRRYYWTAMHELVHSTGHANRLGRKGITEPTEFGSTEYAREELVAEIGSCIAAAELGFEPDIDQSAAYIASWRQKLADDPDLVSIAAQRAAKAVDLLFTTTEDDQ